MDTLSALFFAILVVATTIGVIKLLGLWNILEAQKKDAESWGYISWDERSLSDTHHQLVEAIADGKRGQKYFRSLEAIEAAIAMRTRLGVKENMGKTSMDSTSAHQLRVAPGESHPNTRTRGRSADLFDVEGIPVSLGNMPGTVPYCAAWDVVPPRVFDPESARRNGAPVLVDEFMALLTPEAGHYFAKSMAPITSP